MRVLVTTPRLERPGGVAAYFEVLAPHLNDMASYFYIGAITDDESLIKRVLRVVANTWMFAYQLVRHRPDLVHLNPSLVNLAMVRDGILLLVAKLFACRVIVFLHGWDQQLAESLKKGAVGWIFRVVFTRADAFVVLAHQFAQELREMGIHRPVFLETTTVHDDFFVTPPRRIKAAGDPVCILFLARVERVKGIFEALEAYRLLQDRYPNVRLMVVGDGSDLPAARAYTDGTKLDIEFTGFLRGAAKLQAFSAADIYLFPSHAEGMPISVLEAMAVGLPVVTTCVGGLADFFEDGAMGFLLEDADPARMAERLAVLINNTSQVRAIGNYNAEYARQRFASALVAQRLRDIYQRVIKS